MNPYNYLIYHRNCLDGFSALLVAYIARLFLPGKIWFHAIGADEKAMPPHLHGDHRVLILDVNMTFGLVEQIVRRASSVVMIDHHISPDNHKIRDLVGEKFRYVHDVRESAVSLIWAEAFPTKPLPRFFQYIKDNDLATWKIKETQSFILGLEVKHNVHYGLSREMTLKKLDEWKALINDEPAIDKLIRLGRKMKLYQKMVMEKTEVNSEIVEMSKPGQGRKLRVMVSNGCVFIARKLAVRLSKKKKDRIDLAIVWYYNVGLGKIQCVVRSDDMPITWLLEMYGAAGHGKAGTFCYPAKHVYQWLHDHEEFVKRKERGMR